MSSMVQYSSEANSDRSLQPFLDTPSRVTCWCIASSRAYTFGGSALTPVFVSLLRRSYNASAGFDRCGASVAGVTNSSRMDVEMPRIGVVESLMDLFGRTGLGGDGMVQRKAACGSLPVSVRPLQSMLSVLPTLRAKATGACCATSERLPSNAIRLRRTLNKQIYIHIQAVPFCVVLAPPNVDVMRVYQILQWLSKLYQLHVTFTLWHSDRQGEKTVSYCEVATVQNAAYKAVEFVITTQAISHCSALAICDVLWSI